MSQCLGFAKKVLTNIERTIDERHNWTDSGHHGILISADSVHFLLFEYVEHPWVIWLGFNALPDLHQDTKNTLVCD